MRYSILILITALFALFIVASVALYTIDFARDFYDFGMNFFFKKYVFYILFGILVSTFLTFYLKKDFFENKALMWIFYLIVVGFLLLPLFGPFSYKVNGANRWIKVPGFSVTFQPSELAKIFVIYFLAIYIKDNKEKIKHIWFGLLKPLLLISPLLFLIFIEPDLSTTLLILLVAITLLYFSGARLVQVIFLILVLVLIAFVLKEIGFIHDYQLDRLKAFLSNEMQWQVKKAYDAIGNGGFFGTGLALGKYYFFVPQSESDFIIATIGENFGYFGILLIVISYLFIVSNLIKIADEVKDDVVRYFIWGYAVLMLFQVVINMGVVSRIFPVTGIPLPFVSYGGSSILSFSIGLGIIFAGIYNQE
ncbi:FtsW/RodA/SpoVE family cell cycle protein [Thermosipho sp. 1074]|uniref:FtsW/RodA/SpoVE family cell cycle protein n=1 Tax=Thermosipho sp. 1074 TaxID=1643331 RepID=UPI000987A896|nr:FtsW/RodA/SpoVE family cell cycle protein [Thermosipho sp. 1074]OOC43545.1 cell cycle protein [Thermosipho sp. 1074]